MGWSPSEVMHILYYQTQRKAANVRKVKGIKHLMRFLKTSKSFALPVATALLLCIPAAFIAVDIYLASERDVAASKAAQTGQPELELIDPTIGTYDGGPELALLAAADPDGARYLHSHPVTITALHDEVFNKFFVGLSANPVGTKAIILRQDKLTTPGLWAIAISHELVHVQHGDPASPLSHESLSHRLWITEEGEAHLRALETAHALHAPSIDPAWQDYIFNIYNLPITYALIVLYIVGFWVTRQFWRLPPKGKARLSTERRRRNPRLKAA